MANLSRITNLMACHNITSYDIDDLNNIVIFFNKDVHLIKEINKNANTALLKPKVLTRCDISFYVIITFNVTIVVAIVQKLS
jgi:hypothetical protein